jgi:hypothetical protein
MKTEMELFACHRPDVWPPSEGLAKRTAKVFYFSTLEQLSREGLWSTVWERPDGKGLKSGSGLGSPP